MKKLILVVVSCAALLTPAVVGAHEGHLHNALGTVSAIDGDHVTIKQTNGKTIMVMLDKTTTVTRGKDKLSTAALKVGERLSVDYMEEKSMMMARTIKLSTAPAKK